MMDLGQIFSIKVSTRHKIITILGIKLKIKYNRFTKYKKLKIQKNKIVFSNFHGNGFGCNPKYILLEILKRKLPYDLVWLVNGDTKNKDIPTGVRVVSYKSNKSYKEQATAKIWICNIRKVPFIYNGLQKKNNQVYIQTWHGSLGIKKIDADVSKNYDEKHKIWVEAAHKDSQMTDYLISNSSFEDNVLVNGLWFTNKVYKVGHPRNDIFFYTEKDKQDIKEKVKTSLNIPSNKKILLYIPSFRDDLRLYCYGLNTKKLQETLGNKFSGDWVILIRMHPHLAKYSHQLFKFSENVIDASFYPDIQELLVAADAAISDYSSCIFDFMLQRKPAFIFASDIDDYDQDRGFYFPLSATPFPVAEDNETLAQNIALFDDNVYQKKIDEFLKNKGCMEDGHASERVVDLIEKIINGEHDA